MPPEQTQADVCLILEGTYPYTSGGVSSWTHDLIQTHNHLTFHLVALIAADAEDKRVYELPANVIGLKTIRLQSLPQGVAELSLKDEKALFQTLGTALAKFQSSADLSDLHAIMQALAPHRRKIGQRLLLDSPAAWNLVRTMYQATMSKTSFLDYFWSWRGLFGGLFSILLADIPPARVYHGLCTGYAGLMLARAHLETGSPCILTEHGIYTNERRIEIASADWLDDPKVFDLAVGGKGHEKELKDFWIDTFNHYSRFCYDACSQIITLYEGNQEFQRMDGADEEKLRVIPNGIDPSRYNNVHRQIHPPTIALIGRVVPIKDIKTYIKAAHILAQSIPDLRAYILGPEDEDPDYAEECHELVTHLGLGKTVFFTGKVRIEDYLGMIDVLALTSLSEAQPLVILEAGALGIPTVATDVGACREMIMGSSHEWPKLGAGGAIVGLGSPQAAAQAFQKLLNDPKYYIECSKAIAARVRASYSKADQTTAYADLYRQLIEGKVASSAQIEAKPSRSLTYA